MRSSAPSAGDTRRLSDTIQPRPRRVRLDRLSLIARSNDVRSVGIGRERRRAQRPLPRFPAGRARSSTVRPAGRRCPATRARFVLLAPDAARTSAMTSSNRLASLATSLRAIREMFRRPPGHVLARFDAIASFRSASGVTAISLNARATPAAAARTGRDRASPRIARRAPLRHTRPSDPSRRSSREC